MIYYGNELYHHGIKGQKWGERNYQNEDGSWTEKGLKRRREDYDGLTRKQKKRLDKVDAQKEELKKQIAQQKKEYEAHKKETQKEYEKRISMTDDYDDLMSLTPKERISAREFELKGDKKYIQYLKNELAYNDKIAERVKEDKKFKTLDERIRPGKIATRSLWAATNIGTITASSILAKKGYISGGMAAAASALTLIGSSVVHIKNSVKRSINTQEKMRKELETKKG